MYVIINGESRNVPDGLNLVRLIEHFSLPSQRVAIELNESVVRRREWEDIAIKEADIIEVIHFVGGG